MLRKAIKTIDGIKTAHWIEQPDLAELADSFSVGEWTPERSLLYRESQQGKRARRKNVVNAEVMVVRSCGHAEQVTIVCREAERNNRVSDMAKMKCEKCSNKIMLKHITLPGMPPDEIYFVQLSPVAKRVGKIINIGTEAKK